MSISFRLIEEALELAGEPAGGKAEMPSGWNLRRGRQELWLEFEAFNGRNEATDYQYTLPVPGTVEVPELGARVEARIVDADGVPQNERGQLLDPERMPKEVLIRNWRPGDRFWPAHTAAEKKVKELLSDRHATGAREKAVAGCGRGRLRPGLDAGVCQSPRLSARPAAASRAIWIREIAGMM